MGIEIFPGDDTHDLLPIKDRQEPDALIRQQLGSFCGRECDGDRSGVLVHDIADNGHEVFGNTGMPPLAYRFKRGGISPG